MDNNSIPGASVKLFAGFLVNSELKMHLNSSKSWKNIKLIPSNPIQDLTETRYENHHYIGRFLDTDQVTLSTLKDYEHQICQKLQEYCPQIEATHFKFYLFSQLFIH